MTLRHIVCSFLAVAMIGASPAPTPSPTPAPAPPEVLRAAAAFFKAVGDKDSGAAYAMMTKYSQNELIKTVAADQKMSEDAVREAIKTKPSILDFRFEDVRSLVTTGPWKDAASVSCWAGVLWGAHGALADCPAWHAIESEPLRLEFEDGAWRVAWTETLFGG